MLGQMLRAPLGLQLSYLASHPWLCRAMAEVGSGT